MSYRFIESNTTPGTWYRIDLERAECTCKANREFRNDCSHLKRARRDAAEMLDRADEDRVGELHEVISDALDRLALGPQDVRLIATAIQDERDGVQQRTTANASASFDRAQRSHR